MNCGSSSVEIFEIEPYVTTQKIGNQEIKLKPMNLSNINLKSYIVIEKYNNFDFSTIDIVYGNIKIDELKNNEERKKYFFEKVLSRENLIQITREKFGLLPDEVKIDRNNKVNLINDVNIMRLLAKTIYENSYSGIRTQPLKTIHKGSINPESKFKIVNPFLNKPSIDEKMNESLNIENIPEEIIFYRSGAVIVNNKICLRINYVTRDNTTGNSTKIDSFLIDLANEKILSDEENRKKFIEKVLEPSRLESARYIKGFPFIGSFTNDGNFRNNIEIALALSKINQDYEKSINQNDYSDSYNNSYNDR